MQIADRGRTANTRCHDLQGIRKSGCSAEAHSGSALPVAAHPDDVAAVFLSRCDLVPEVQRMYAVEGLAGAVEVDIPRVVGELAPRCPPRSASDPW